MVPVPFSRADPDVKYLPGSAGGGGATKRICQRRIIVVQGTNSTLPSALISAYVGLETSNHHDGQDPFSEPVALSGMGLGMCSRRTLLGSRCLPLLRSRLWVIGGEGDMSSMTVSIVGILLASWAALPGWRNFSDMRSACWTRLRTAGSKCVLKTP